MRHIDKTGISGTGIVAEGVQFNHSKCVVRWLTRNPSLVFWDSLHDFMQVSVYGHGENSNEIVWIDNDHA